MVGFETSDDAAVYKIDEKTAMIQTVDIFPPVVDDPYQYGKIAAANSLSDVYAMGGTPKLALNVFCFPEDLPKETVQAILQGGYEKVAEAGAVIAGGHTIKDPEPKYGLSVTGFAAPEEILLNSRMRPGDIVLLTKKIGTGVLTTAAKGELLSKQDYDIMLHSMTRLNRKAAEVMKRFPVNSCTDVTGFGLLGHAFEMAAGSACTFCLDAQAVPMLPGAKEMAELGVIPAGAYRNREYLEEVICITDSLEASVEDLLFDPQTAGGLLISLPERDGLHLFTELRDAGEDVAIAGWVDEFHDYSVFVK